MTIRIGDTAPDFSLPDQDGRTFSLSEQVGRRILLVFYPGDDTPVCTRQMCDYRDGIEQFSGLGVEVVGISRDDAQSHQAFRRKHDLPFTLLSDPDMAVAAQYGCKGVLGMKRGVFLINTDGVVRHAHVESIAMFRRSREELVEVISALE
ncbi:MAG TPA: peroxiredoxin [Wenzhouxiangella sp.]|nr:peroxiredoxin [Wenzhouxiangella sp.]